VFRKKLAYPDLKRAVREQHRLYNASNILIEDKASGTQLVQDLVAEGLSDVTGIKGDGDNIMRIHAQTATIENGFVHLPTSAPRLADYVHEFVLFSAGRQDDQVDSTAQAIAWTKLRPLGRGIVELYQQETELRTNAENGEGPMVRLRAPEGTTHVYTLGALSHGDRPRHYRIVRRGRSAAKARGLAGG
jgi:predicted phage terminase large subunit-like protein